MVIGVGGESLLVIKIYWYCKKVRVNGLVMVL